jgi:hypothetical protein|tara:strand:- start:2487 stop:2717 length:231 start_codon:yes stop_codon:yes gene_type:complete
VRTQIAIVILATVDGLVSRRKRPNYIAMRMEDLKNERDNPHNSEYDSLWYNRIIQELDWAQQAELSAKKRNCFMEN